MHVVLQLVPVWVAVVAPLLPLDLLMTGQVIGLVTGRGGVVVRAVPLNQQPVAVA